MFSSMSTSTQPLLKLTDRGIYCERGDFFIDPWRPVDCALITHAHSDHSHPGHKSYISTESSRPFIESRLGEIKIKGRAYGEKFKMGDTWVSFHPAGHVLGSAQVRVEYKNCVWVASGDYKRTLDPSCQPFEVVECDSFITEATFGLPIYHWESGATTAKKILEWSQAYRGPSLVFCYAFGKAQRILAELHLLSNRPVYLHGAMERLTQLYRDQNVPLIETKKVSEQDKNYDFAGDLILAPPSAHRSQWMKRFKLPQTAFASGWMAVRGQKRRRGYESGFVLSDHADWPELLETIRATKAKDVYVTHGQSDVLARYLREEWKIKATPLQTLFEGESDDRSLQ